MRTLDDFFSWVFAGSRNGRAIALTRHIQVLVELLQRCLGSVSQKFFKKTLSSLMGLW